MIYNVNSSGLNGSPWDTQFDLSIISNIIWEIEEDTFMMDRDVGEIFLNFVPRYKFRPCCGLDVTHVMSEDNLE